MRPSRSERIRKGPNTSENLEKLVKTLKKTCENIEKLRENVYKNFFDIAVRLEGDMKEAKDQVINLPDAEPEIVC